MTNKEWLDNITDHGMATRVYKIILQNITPSLEDSITLFSFLVGIFDQEGISEIKQILYKNFPSQKDHERIGYLFSFLEKDNNGTPVS